MSNNKQSSVEWLFCALIDRGYKNPHDMELISIIEKAKAMHKEEIEKAWVGGKNCLNGEQYYNQTYGGNNED